MWPVIFWMLAGIPIADWEMPAGEASLAVELSSHRELLAAVWIERGPIHGGQVKLAHWDGANWSEPVSAPVHHDLFVNWADTPKVAVTVSGTYATWPEKLGEGTYACGVRAAVTDGQSYGAPFWLHDDRSATEHGFPSLVPYQDGVLAIWLDGRKMADESGQMQLRARTLSPKGLGPEMLVDDQTCECCATAAVFVRDRVQAAYRNKTNEHIRDNTMRVWQGIDWQDGPLLDGSRWSLNGCPVNGPALTALDHRWAAAWFTGADDSPRVYVSVQGVSKPLQLGKSPLGRVAIAAVGDSLFVSWVDLEPNARLSLVRIGVGSDLQVDQQWTVAELPEGRSSGFPRLATLKGRLYIAHQAPEGERVIGKVIDIDL